MIQFELDADVPESREVTVTLPPEVPPGRVRLSIAVPGESDSDEWAYCRPSDPRVATEYDAFRKMFGELLATHRGEYVAVYQGRVVASGPTLDGVYRTVRATHGDAPAYIAVVHDGIPEIRIGRVEVFGSETPL